MIQDCTRGLRACEDGDEDKGELKGGGPWHHDPYDL